MTDSDYFSIIESTHEIQNPTSPEKLRLVADYMELGDGDQLLDIGSGKGWWAAEAASRGCQVVGLEVNKEFAAAASERAAHAGVSERVRTVVGPATEFVPAPASYDAVTCLGASFALGSYDDAVRWMATAVRPGGRVAIGDVHAMTGAPTDVTTSANLPTLATLARVLEEENGFDVIGIVSSSIDEWDAYESRHWRNMRAWVSGNPDHPDRATMLARSNRHQNAYLSEERGTLGWSILVAVRETD